MNEYKNLKVEIAVKSVKGKFFSNVYFNSFFKAELKKALTFAEEQMEHAKVIIIFCKSFLRF